MINNNMIIAFPSQLIGNPLARLMAELSAEIKVIRFIASTASLSVTGIEKRARLSAHRPMAAALETGHRHSDFPTDRMTEIGRELTLASFLRIFDRASEDKSSWERKAAPSNYCVERNSQLGLLFCCGKVAMTGASSIKERANAHSVTKDRASASRGLRRSCVRQRPGCKEFSKASVTPRACSTVAVPAAIKPPTTVAGMQWRLGNGMASTSRCPSIRTSAAKASVVGTSNVIVRSMVRGYRTACVTSHPATVR